MVPMSSSSEAKSLLERWQNGDQAAAEALYRRYAQRLCALVQTQLGERLSRRVGADDIVQSVFRTFFRRARGGEFVIDHSGSLWRLLVHIALNKIRSSGRHHGAARRDVAAEVYPSSPELLPEMLVHDPTPAEAAALADELEAVVAGLDSPEPEILRLCLQGYSTPEIAAQIRCSRWTVRRVLDRIGRTLEKRLRGAEG